MTKTTFPQGSMHGVELGGFRCYSGFWRILHLVTEHTVVVASASLTKAKGKERARRAMMTIHFGNPVELVDREVLWHCRDCKLIPEATCKFPRRKVNP